MLAFLLGYVIFLGLLLALAAWRRRGVLPYDDPNRNVTMLRYSQRFMMVFGISEESQIEREDRMSRR